jgi:hypothetical protein
MYTVTPLTVAGALALYGVIFALIRLTWHHRIDRTERKTFYTIALLWGVPVFIGNYLLYRAGLMSFLPWATNFLHAVVWIGFCLSYLYLSVRETELMAVQFLLFATFSFIVKYAEHTLFGTWELDHFFHVFRGNFAYILGWSIADGFYPALTVFGLRLLGRRMSGLVVQ